MIGDYNYCLNQVNGDIQQWQELNKSEVKSIISVNPTTQKISTLITPNFFKKNFSSTDYEALNNWAITKIINSREKMMALTQLAYNSDNVEVQKQALDALSRLDAEIVKAKDTFFEHAAQIKDNRLKDKLNDLGRKMVSTDEFKQAKLRLGEKIQYHSIPTASLNMESVKVYKGTPVLQREGVISELPTPNRPYSINSKDATPKQAEPHNYLSSIMRTAKTEMGTVGIPSQFEKDLHRITEIKLNDKTISEKADPPKAVEVLNQLTGAFGGNQLMAFRLATMLTQTVYSDLAAIAMLEAMPPLPENGIPRFGLGSSSGCLFDVKIDEQSVKISAKTVYNLNDTEELDLNPGALLVKRQITIPLEEFGRVTLNDDHPFPNATITDFWSSTLATDAYAAAELQKF